MAEALENDTLVLRLLTEACVCTLAAELALAEARRWLLLSGEWPKYPRLLSALAAQAALNGGAWPFDAEERGVLERSPTASLARAYYPRRPPSRSDLRYGDRVTDAVAGQYVLWPYPAWSRITSPKPTTVSRAVEKLDGGRESGLPVNAEVLIAGCGTGMEAAYFARRFPDARVTAIDISDASLAFASERCTGLDIDFRLLDLHEVPSLDRSFDLIVCSGVLHHLPDPEVGWARLVEVLNPAGVMKVMLYSRVGRLVVEAAKRHISDLREQPVDDELLRAARARLIENAPRLLASSTDFYTLTGVHDLLFNRHEDSFDVPRIAHALDRLSLELLAFILPSPSEENRYREEHPDDPLFRDLDAFMALEKKSPFLFAGMYEFWCRRRR
jgi:SAM-dependent methyltransferase